LLSSWGRLRPRLAAGTRDHGVYALLDDLKRPHHLASALSGDFLERAARVDVGGVLIELVAVLDRAAIFPQGPELVRVIGLLLVKLMGARISAMSAQVWTMVSRISVSSACTVGCIVAEPVWGSG